ncbi:unnamed protein product [Brassica rapa subsp. narinosa]
MANNYIFLIKFCASLILSGLPLQHMWFTTVFVTLRSHRYFHIEGSFIQLNVGSILEGNMFHIFVIHCNCAVDMFCDETSGVVYVARDD